MRVWVRENIIERSEQRAEIRAEADGRYQDITSRKEQADSGKRSREYAAVLSDSRIQRVQNRKQRAASTRHLPRQNDAPLGPIHQVKTELALHVQHLHTSVTQVGIVFNV
jgi:hypothetical protein